MLSRHHFPLRRSWIARAACGLATLAALLLVPAAPARAQNNLLRGPAPFLRDNELSAHFLLAAGAGDSWSGTKVSFEYGFRLRKPLWLDLQLNAQKGTCSLTPGNCARSGSAWETMAGLKAKFTTESPFVPYAKGVAGLIYLFPEEAHSAVGLALRAGGGIEYFFWDWFAAGIEGNLSIGHGFFDSSYTFGHGYVVFDFGGGVEFQF